MQLQPSDALPKIMLARYYGANLGRFLSVDPVGGRASRPQGWNAYSYVLNNPLKLLDPDGREAIVADAVGQTWTAVADGVRPWESSSVQILIEGQGSDLTVSIDPRPINDALSGGMIADIGPSENFQTLADAVNSTQVVELHTATDTFTSSGQELTLGQSDPVSTAIGHTVTPDRSDDGNTQVYVRSDQTGEDRTGVMWHELRGHASPAMQGQPSGHTQGDVDSEARKGEAEARVNHRHQGE